MKILIKIKDNKLSFYNKKKLNQEYKNMLNTNVISNDELVFSDEYINKNTKIVLTFLNELIKDYELNTLVFQNMDVASLIMPFINKLKNVTTIYFDSDEVLPYKYCEIICKNYTCKYISANYIPQYMFEMLDKNDIVPESRNELLFTSNFMNINGLNNFASIYYKYSIYMDCPLSENDMEDFTTFCKINKNLKSIIINVPSRFIIEDILHILNKTKHKHVKIVIHGDINDIELINFLKKYNKIIKKKYKISIKIQYSDKFIKENIVKETNNNILKCCSLLMLFISIVAISYVVYDDYASKYKDKKINNEINEFIENHTIDNPNETEIIPDENQTIIEPNNYITSLKEINNEVVGWLKVNNTNINYPIVQHSDNQYYLDYNIYKQKDRNGWLYMDYENNPNTLDDNTIIYGHSRYVSGVMFGTLIKTMNKDWYENQDNQIISFDLEYGSYKFKIFSVYTIKTTSDYLVTRFDSARDKLSFIQMIKERSINDFNVALDENSKILTLSTCFDNTSRLVVHSVLIEEN